MTGLHKDSRYMNTLVLVCVCWRTLRGRWPSEPRRLARCQPSQSEASISPQWGEPGNILHRKRPLNWRPVTHLDMQRLILLMLRSFPAESVWHQLMLENFWLCFVGRKKITSDVNIKRCRFFYWLLLLNMGSAWGWMWLKRVKKTFYFSLIFNFNTGQRWWHKGKVKRN